MFGNPETTPGGLALKFHASVRLEVRRAEALKDGTDQTGSRTRVKVVKNKLSPPFRDCEFDIIYGEGISKMGELIDLGVKAGIVEKSGAWFSYDSQRIGQGRENAKQFLSDNEEMAIEIESKIRSKIKTAMAPKAVGGSEDKIEDLENIEEEGTKKSETSQRKSNTCVLERKKKKWKLKWKIFVIK